jgi:nicotinamidase/pyrazinamidase
MKPASLPVDARKADAAMTRQSALLLIDVQNDFCHGGALAVPGSDKVVATLNGYIRAAVAEGTPIYASRDWHPAVTTHFEKYGGQWPVHCVQNTDGAKFHEKLELPPRTIVVTTGDEPDRPGYSAFEGRTGDGKTFLTDLRQRRIDHLYVGGLATDYCVKHSVLDALKGGLDVTVLEDAIAGVDLKPGDSARAIAEMREAGARVERPEGLKASSN